MTMIEIFVWTIGLTLLTALISKKMSDQESLKTIKNDMEKFRDAMKIAQKRKDIDEANKMMKFMLSLNKKYFMYSIKPTLISLFIFTTSIIFMGIFYADTVIHSPINIPFIGRELSWFWWYLIISIPTSMIFRKLLDVK